MVNKRKFKIKSLPKNAKKYNYIPRQSRVWNFIYKRKQPNKIMTFIDLGDGLVLNVHTDIVLYDFKEYKMYKGDLV